MEKEIFMLVVSGMLGLFTFLIRSYFSNIRKDIKNVSDKVMAIDGKLDYINTELTKRIVESTKIDSEVKAIWRLIDPPRRRSDAGRTS